MGGPWSGGSNFFYIIISDPFGHCGRFYGATDRSNRAVTVSSATSPFLRYVSYVLLNNRVSTISIHLNYKPNNASARFIEAMSQSSSSQLSGSRKKSSFVCGAATKASL